MSQVIPTHLLELMDPAERAKLGKDGLLPSERQESVDLKLERQIHGLIINELRRRDIFYIHSRTDKKTTVLPGLPDFIFVIPSNQIPMAVEVKLPGRTLSKVQIEVRDDMERCAWIYSIVYSFEEFAALLKTWGAD